MTEKTIAPQAERLALIQEEASEVGHAVAKIVRHGFESSNPMHPGSPSNRQALSKEVGHLLLACDLLMGAKDVDVADVFAEYRRKAESIHKWLHNAENSDLALQVLKARPESDGSLTIIELQTRLKGRENVSAEQAERIKSLESQVKRLTETNAHLSRENGQLTADINRQAGYIDRVLEIEPPQAAPERPGRFDEPRTLIAKGPRLQSRYGDSGASSNIHDFLR